MRNGPIIVVVLVLAAVFGAWLGPAGERVDPEVGPMEAFFKYAIRRAGPVDQVYLAVGDKAPADPPTALMARFAGDIFPYSKLEARKGTWCSISLSQLEWKQSNEGARCEGLSETTEASEVLATELHLTSRGKWVVDRAETYDGPTRRWSPVPSPSH